jgi:hypothetical protein
MPSKVQLINGNFQDAEGNVLALGNLVLELSQDEQLSSLAGQVASGIKITISLNSSGSVSTSPPQSVWPTDVMNPSGASYTVWAYTAEGQLAWGPNYGLTIPSGATYDLDNWVPNSTTGGGGASVGSILLQSNGVNNGDQGKLNLYSSDSSVTITDDGSGDIDLQVGGGGVGPRPSVANWHYSSGITNALSSAGVSVGMSMTGGSTVVNATATEPSYTKVTTTGGPNYQVMYDTVYQITPGNLKYAEWRVEINLTTNCRYWIALTDNTSIGGGELESDTPGCAIVGFRFSTAAGDTAWQAYFSPAGGGTHTVNTTGIAPSTAAGHVFAIQPNGAGYFFFIDGVEVGNFGGAVPASTTLLSMALHVDNAAGGSAPTSIAMAYAYWEGNS